jgi:hypothetical protein
VTVHSAPTALDPSKKAQFLLDTACSLIDAGRSVSFSHVKSEVRRLVGVQHGQGIKKHLDVYLKTSDLPLAQVTQASLARA